MGVLHYVDVRVESPHDPWLRQLKSRLEPHRVRHKASALQDALAFIQPGKLLGQRKELEIYLHAVRVLGTTLGGVLGAGNKSE